MIDLRLGDCLELMKDLRGASIDAVIRFSLGGKCAPVSCGTIGKDKLDFLSGWLLLR